MNKPPNPITQGLRTVIRDPLIFMLEILWRWAFILLACLLVFGVGAMLLGPLPMIKRWPAVWNTHDPQLIGPFLLGIVFRLGNKLIVAAVAVPIAIALLWAILSGLGRTITVKRLRAGVTSLRFRSILALQFLRAFFSYFSLILLIAAIVGGIWIATRGSKPDLVKFYMTVAPSVLFISLFWLISNWYLSLAAIFGRDGQSFHGAIHQARQTVSRQFTDFAGTGFVFLLLRIVLLLIAFAVCGLMSSMAGRSPQSYTGLVTIVVLVYLALAYFLYMARMAAYLALAAAYVEPGAGPRLVVPAAGTSAENSPAQ